MEKYYTDKNEHKKYKLEEDSLFVEIFFVEKMKENQEYIYYASGKTKESILAQPQMDTIKNKGYDIVTLSNIIKE